MKNLMLFAALEYSNDGANWTVIDGKTGRYQYDTVQNVRHSFHLSKMSDYTTVSVRARVASVSRMSGSPLPVNGGATTRVGDHITVSFTKD